MAAWSTTAIASSARQRRLSSQPTISRVQQSMIAFRYVQPCSATQIEVMSSCQSCRAARRRRSRAACAGAIGRRRWISFRSPHHPQHALAVDRAGRASAWSTRPPSGSRRSDSARRPRRSPARPRSVTGRRCGGRSRCRRSVDRLPADLQHTRHAADGEARGDELARPGDALAHSQPRNASPAISKLVGLAAQRPLELATLRRSSFSPLRSSLPASASGRPRAACRASRSRASRRSRARGRPPSPSGRRAARPARSRSSAAPSSSGTSVARSSRSPLRSSGPS